MPNPDDRTGRLTFSGGIDVFLEAVLRLSNHPEMPNKIQIAHPKRLLRLVFALLLLGSAALPTALQRLEEKYNQDGPQLLAELPRALVAPGGRVVNDNEFLETDLGLTLPVYAWDPQDGDYDAFATYSDQYYREHFDLVPLDTPNRLTNCHGWVFLGGRHLLFGEQVELILLDNNYYPVQVPTVGDVIIYRDELGKILHSGLVSVTSPLGSALVESKFGISGRYLHTPDQQPYSDNYTYYRTDRTRHAVQMHGFRAVVQP